MSSKKRLLFFGVLALAVLLAIPYLKAELLTVRYGEAFAGEYRQSGMIDEITYYKVISHSDERAAVFYVTGEHSAGVRMEFEKAGGKWTLAEWSVIWSASGSADGFCWPYYR